MPLVSRSTAPSGENGGHQIEGLVPSIRPAEPEDPSSAESTRTTAFTCRVPGSAFDDPGGEARRGAAGSAGGAGTKREATTTLNSASARFLNVGQRDAQKCFVDSGGPTFHRSNDGVERVVGVTSFGSGDCAHGSTDTRVDAYLPFIYEFLQPFDLPGSAQLGAGATSANEVWFGGANSLDANAARIAAGDFNGDGRTDLVGLYDYAAGYGWVSAGLFVFPGTSSLSAGSTSFYETWFTGPGNFDVTRTAVGAGDWNGDGRSDLVSLYDYSALGWQAREPSDVFARARAHWGST